MSSFSTVQKVYYGKVVNGKVKTVTNFTMKNTNGKLSIDGKMNNRAIHYKGTVKSWMQKVLRQIKKWNPSTKTRGRRRRTNSRGKK
jgi:hypothetical protein